MTAKLIKIKIERFQPGRPVAREIFVSLALNKKMIRVVLTGGELDASFLEKLKKRAVSELFAGVLDGDPEDPDTFPIYSQQISTSVASIRTAEESKQVVAKSPEQVAITTLSATPQAPEKESIIRGSPPVEEEKTRLSATPPQEAVVQKISGLRDALDNTVRVVAKAAAELQAEVTFNAHTELEQCLSKFDAIDGEQDEKTILAAGEQLKEAIQTFENIGGQATDSASIIAVKAALRETVQKFQQTIQHEKPTDGFTGSSQEKYEKRFQQNDQRDAPATNPLGAEEKTLLSGSATKSDNANAFLDISARAAVFKELPATAGRMATYLAHSLGYVHLDYLSDLAFGVILRFSHNDGNMIALEKLPPLIQAILKNEPVLTDSTIEDSLEITLLLEAYFKNPECDRSVKDFSKRLFHSTVNELNGKPDGLNKWNEVRWVQFVEKGPSLDAHSLCSKATAKAIKLLKEISA